MHCDALTLELCCRSQVPDSRHHGLTPAAAFIHSSGCQGHTVGHGYHELHACQAFPAGSRRSLFVPHCSVQSSEHCQCNMGFCQVQLQPWQVVPCCCVHVLSCAWDIVVFELWMGHCNVHVWSREAMMSSAVTDAEQSDICAWCGTWCCSTL